jgi:hypothetical protein
MKLKLSAQRRAIHQLMIFALLCSLMSIVAATEEAHATPAYSIGDTGPGGGKIFYFSADGFACGPDRASTCTYLEAAPSGWNTGADPGRSWAQSTPVNYQGATVNNDSSPETATATAIGWGYRNTRAIIAQGNSNTATSVAALADSHSVTVSGVIYDDWYLPSKDELNQMCKWQRGITGANLTTLTTVCTGGTINTGTGAAGFEGGYWSSTESGESSKAWGQDFNNGAQGIGQKNLGNLVRPIRAFAEIGPAAKVTVTRAALGTQRGAAFSTQPQITVQDANNNTVTSSSAVVTASITSGAGGTLVGSTTATAVSGIATFVGFGINGTIGTTYTITYSATGLTAATATVTLTGTTCDGGSFTCQVGDTGPGGGTIYYYSSSGFSCGPTRAETCNYLEVAPSNWSGGSDPLKFWANASDYDYYVTGVSKSTDPPSLNEAQIGLGYKDSLAIINNGRSIDTTTAAGSARTYSGGSKNDWYLPAPVELNLLCQWARGVTSSVTTSCTGGTLNSATYGASAAGFQGDYYWTSTQADGYPPYAYSRNFGTGASYSALKNSGDQSALLLLHHFLQLVLR